MKCNKNLFKYKKVGDIYGNWKWGRLDCWRCRNCNYHSGNYFMFPVKKKTNLRGDKKISAIIDYAIALLTVCMYLLNNYLIKNITTGITNRFFMCYFNDFLCPIVFLAYTNRLLAYVGKGLYNAGSITLLCGACGCVWEFVAPLINRKSVTDLFDMCAYCLGGVVYWTVHKVIKNGKK